MTSSDNEKLIEEAFAAHEGTPSWEDDPIARDAAIRWHMRGFTDGIEAAEKAHTPTDDEREALIHVIYESQFMGSHRLVIRDDQRTADAVLAAGFRRSEVPEPSAALAAIERAKAFLTDVSETSEMRNRNAYGALKGIATEPQGEPSDAQLKAGAQKYAAQRYREVIYLSEYNAAVTAFVEGAEWARAAGGVR